MYSFQAVLNGDAPALCSCCYALEILEIVVVTCDVFVTMVMAFLMNRV